MSASVNGSPRIVEAGGPGVSVEQVLTELNARINTIEEAYEFMLAYASQGLSSDQGSDVGTQAREFLKRCDGSLDGLGPFLSAFIERRGLEPLARFVGYAVAAVAPARKSYGNQSPGPPFGRRNVRRGFDR